MKQFQTLHQTKSLPLLNQFCENSISYAAYPTYYLVSTSYKSGRGPTVMSSSW